MRALRTQSSTPFPLTRLLRKSETAKTRSLQPVRSTQESALLLPKRARIKIASSVKLLQCPTTLQTTIQPFISSQKKRWRDHSGIPHGGVVLHSGKIGWENENNAIIEYSLKLDSNPEFTSSVIVAYARAAYRMSKEGMSGCKTVFDIPPAYLSEKSGEELRKALL